LRFTSRPTLPFRHPACSVSSSPRFLAERLSIPVICSLMLIISNPKAVDYPLDTPCDNERRSGATAGSRAYAADCHPSEPVLKAR
jgi:hypothetical protein